MRPSADALLREAIASRSLLRLAMGDQPRIVEPYGQRTQNRRLRLFAFQIAGPSRSGTIPNWRLQGLDGVREVELLDVGFESRRPAAYRPHLRWDPLIASMPGAPGPAAAPALAWAADRKKPRG